MQYKFTKYTTSNAKVTLPKGCVVINSNPSSNDPLTFLFEIGERVVDSFFGNGTVIDMDLDNGNFSYHDLVYEIKFDSLLDTIKIRSKDNTLKRFHLDEKLLKCTCGAKYTSSPNIHMANVCDLWKPINR